jgi:glutathione S-transferase
MLTVIGPSQTRTFRVLWMLQELGLPHAHDPSPPRSDRVRAHNPSGKVPVLLLEDGTALTDSVAIVTWLADSTGQLTAPAGTTARARQDAVTQFVVDELDAVLWMAARHSFVLPQEHRLPAIKDSLRWEFRQAAARLAGRLGDGPWLMGEALSVPDIVAAQCLGWARTAGFPIEEPALHGYMARITARPAYLAAGNKGQATAAPVPCPGRTGRLCPCRPHTGGRARRQGVSSGRD